MIVDTRFILLYRYRQVASLAPVFFKQALRGSPKQAYFSYEYGGGFSRRRFIYELSSCPYLAKGGSQKQFPKYDKMRILSFFFSRN